MRIRSARQFLCLVSLLLSAPFPQAHAQAPAEGEVTVRLTQGLDSATERPGQTSQGSVMKSTNPAVPRGTPAIVQLQPDQASGGFSVRLVQLGGAPAASSAVVLTGFSKALSFTRQPGAPPNTVSGARVFLPQNTDVRFTLAPAPPPAPAAAAAARAMQGASRPSAPPPPPPPPPHPANTVRALPPAAPGYPPLEASRDARDTCWWTPYVSEKLGLEMAVERCENPELNTFSLVDSETALKLKDGPNAKELVDVFTVEQKPAAATMDAILRQRYILKLKSPVERTACRPKREDHDFGNLQNYTVIATGAYAKRKEFQGDDGPPDAYPCSDLGGNDVISSYWLYNPTESQTKFFYVHGPGEYEIELDLGSIHFKQAP